MLDNLPKPAVMGVLNVTPDSFSDGGRYIKAVKAVQHAERMVQAGVDIIDVGGESTRPGATPLAVNEELERVIPVLEQLRRRFDIPLSIDTSKPEVMLAAAELGVDLINDVRALQNPGALAVVAESNLPVCLMHMSGLPENMQQKPTYKDVVAEIITFFRERLQACTEAGISLDKVVLDPGFGFGKTPQHNLQIVNRLQEFECLHRPLLVGLSRKRTIGEIVAGGQTKDSSELLILGSVVGALVCVRNGASIIRVHDVAETKAALMVEAAIVAEKVR
ncbi:MAG: dihydropteroate synthase [Pseudomonadales bacterium]|nr:dihydropteroate synthase [Pseudomonadales bacterium]